MSFFYPLCGVMKRETYQNTKETIFPVKNYEINLLYAPLTRKCCQTESAFVFLTVSFSSPPVLLPPSSSPAGGVPEPPLHLGGGGRAEEHGEQLPRAAVALQPHRALLLQPFPTGG